LIRLSGKIQSKFPHFAASKDTQPVLLSPLVKAEREFQQSKLHHRGRSFC
jgi:hypothetical protein